MEILGLQKLTLIDYPGNLACTLFLFGCNFRCGFCHNPELVIPEKAGKSIPEEKILNFLNKRKKYLEGVCITGGEPLLNKKLPEFLNKIRKLNYKIKIDTNGSNPEMLRKIIKSNLVDYIAMDIKADRENYDILAGTEVNIKNIGESIKIILNSEINYEFRTTVIKNYHNKKIIGNIGKWLKKINGEIDKFVIQNFKPRKGKMINEKFEKIPPFKNEELKKFEEIMNKYVKEVLIRE